MLNKNLRYYRLKKNLTKKELAALIDITPMAITHYENGERRPSMTTIKALAKALNVKVSDFLANRNEKLIFIHGEFRKSNKLTVMQQDLICASVEEYLNRFYSILEILGGAVLPAALACHSLQLAANAEDDAKALRKYLRLSEEGPVGDLVEILENKGILLYFLEFDDAVFSGMNGLVDGRPYIVINEKMTPERIRSTIVHELAHAIFVWPAEFEDKDIEERATAISGAFLLSEKDAKRELGLRRKAVTKDMTLICKEYGISMYLLVKRANLCGIITDSAAKNFYIEAAKHGWKRNEPVRIEKERPLLFAQLVFRAVSENEISIQRGAELLKQPYDYVRDHCFGTEG